MAKKVAFPNRPCPKCGAPIHIKTKTHECGWSLDGWASVAPAPKKRKKRRTKAGVTESNASITIADIEAVKSVVDKLGAEKVRQLAEVLDTK